MKCTGTGGTSGFSYETVPVSAAANQSPNAGITMTSGGNTAYENQVMNLSGAPADVSFSASRSSDPDGSISSYNWKINGTQVSTSNSFNYTLAAGTHQIFLTVKDNKGAAGSVGASVIISAKPLGFYVQPNGKSEVYDISGGEFRHVTPEEAAGISNFWNLIKSFDVNSIPLVRRAGEYRVDATLFGKQTWVQNEDTFNKIGFDWNKVITDLKGNNGPILNKRVADAISLWWEVINIVNPGVITCRNMTTPSGVCSGWTDRSISPGNGTNNSSGAITYIPTVGGLYEFKVSSNPEDSVKVDVKGFQCSDILDNDGDGLVDMADPGCSDPTDDDETNVGVPIPQCSDSIDNDGDGFIDMADPGCSNPNDDDETNAIVPKPACSDGADNDGDGKIDFPVDPGCSNLNDPDERDGIVPPTLTVTLGASPSSGDEPLTSTLTATVAGTAVGPIDYNFDCGNGDAPGIFNGVNNTTRTFNCTYANSGNYVAAVAVRRDTAPVASDTEAISVTLPLVVIPKINIFEPF